MYTITKEFHFSAAHALPSLPASHKCHNLHGHNYTVILRLSGETLNEHGFVVDYAEMQPLKHLLDNVFDHKNLNEVEELGGTQTTAENLAFWLFGWCCSVWGNLVESVTVKETEKTSATFKPSGRI